MGRDLFSHLSSVPTGAKVLPVSELTAQIGDLLADAFPNVWVTGEVSNVARPSSGHVYLTIKDSQAQLQAVMWRNLASRLRFELTDGMELILRGKVGVYPAKGNYQFYIEEIHPKGVGALELAFRQLKEKLEKRGWFDAARKKPLPRFPRRIGIVTSPTGAVIRDMLRIIPRRWPAAEIVVRAVSVQGAAAAGDIAAAIDLFNRHRLVDVLIVGRGGGSLEDLWAFNEEVVAAAIHRSAIPVISAVGHEVDFTIADFVADRRAATPSEAAEMVVPDCEEVRRALRQRAGRMTAAVAQRLAAARQRLAVLAGRRVFRQPLARIHAAAQLLDAWAERARRALRVHLDRKAQLARTAAGRLAGLSPLNVLARGYSLTQRLADGQVVRSVAGVRPGDAIVTRLADGRLVSRVEVVHGEEGPGR
jgi:exodeoxyribonuclease VII large subunit